ncbi:TadE/TadG family type IV pilus assembly protein [Hyphococcus sp.]|uniref:TadE/TadG family type IV pilus assembly protein n=1 Tax=Hyphococcus sp. TaxID=2038636 RepID=UPI0035C78083
MFGFGKNRNGNVAILTAMLMPVVLMFSGGAVDFFSWNNQRVKLKELADTLATRGAREFLLANATEFQIKAVINNVIDSGYAAAYGFADLSTAISVDSIEGEVSVHLTTPPTDALFLNKFDPFKKPLEITSTAIAHGGMNVCVVALHPDADGAVSTDHFAVLDASPCSIFSNSVSTKGVSAKMQSQINAGLTCSGGGVEGSVSNFAPFPTMDCPAYPDPLAERQPPSVGACTEIDFEVGSPDDNATEITYYLSPGVYCGGLKIRKHARVFFDPGVYVIKDGPLEVGKFSTLDGENVGFYLLGDAATFRFEKEATITMTAPRDGPLAGIMFFEDRNAPLDRVHKIESDDARKFLGTFYLSRGVLEVNTQKPVADDSAYTAIVARRLSLIGRPSLVLNADYAGTEIPVPEGVGPVGNTISLRE